VISEDVVKGEDVKGEDAVHRALTRLRSIRGLVTASLVEPNSAHVLETVVAGSTGDTGSEAAEAAHTVAAGASDIVQVIALMAAGLSEPDELEDVIITLGRRHHLITAVPGAGSDGLLIVVTLDRTRTNLALARQQVHGLGPLLDVAAGPDRVS
jgi:hypothetical protein